MTAVDLLKLEKLETGGVRGRALSQQVQLLHQEFVDTYKFLTEKPYDCLDLNNRVWSDMMAGCIKLLSTSHSTCLFFLKLAKTTTTWSLTVCGANCFLA